MGCSVTTTENRNLFLPKYTITEIITDVLPTFTRMQWLISTILNYLSAQKLVLTV